MGKKLIVGITGASGSIYGKLLLEKLDGLRDQISDCGVIFSENAIKVWEFELDSFDPSSLPFTTYDPNDFFAPMASGSAGYDTMIICPCTMGTLGRIASGVSSDLMTRAADVMLKEQRKLILVPREAPYSLIHLHNMKFLTEAGAIICPASPSFYSKPQGNEELAMTVVDRVLALTGFEFPKYNWGEQNS
ncbi:MAG: UbiX family flavin prenyltransferase [Bacteroidales bacterium]|nr:UbiX family flavin prenyltransferase [Bacteroidota bacterium]MBL6950444.1 UbiX family flavin prenyltransferase [Bacteroidales bacterium]